MATALDLLMSTKEDVNLLSEESDICTIDAKTRVIFVPSTIVVGGVQSDKNAERIKFSCPKIVGDNLDLSKFSVRINFENVSSVDFNVSIKDQYICDDVAVDGENVTFSWLIGRNAARYMGTVRFIVCAVKTDSDSNISVEWNTTIAEVPVLEGIEIDQPQIGQEEKDVINQLLELTKNTSAEAVQNVNSAKEQAIKDIQSVSQPDTTLTIEGGLAEAKATGEAIGSLKEELGNVVGTDSLNKQLFNKNDFSVGGMRSGLKTDDKNRITNAGTSFKDNKPIKCKKGDVFKIKVNLSNSDFIGCRIGIHEVSDDFFVLDSGWIQDVQNGAEYTIQHHSTTGFNIQFSFSKTSNIVTTNKTEFVGVLELYNLLSNVKFSISKGDIALTNIELENKYKALWDPLSVPNDLIYKPNTISNVFITANTSYRLQGCAISNDYLYYSMTTPDNSESYIYKVSLENGEIINSISGNYGHVGDMTYNALTNEIVTLNAVTSYSDLFFFDADTLEYKKTIRINTDDWRLSAISYNQSTNGYIVEFAKNNTWSDYKFAFTDINFNIISEFNAINKGQTLQGITNDYNYIYATYSDPNIIIVYNINGAYVGYIELPFSSEAECVAKKNNDLFVGEDGEKKIYKLSLFYKWL